MGKQQLSTVDVAAEVACLRKRILGMNLINIFDINTKTYVLKLGTSGDAGEKVFVVLESGCRLHTTQYERMHSNFPSNFNLKLRKHIRNRRLNDVRQLGVDRIVDFAFGQEDKSMHLILEMYAQGNIVLTDHRYEVLTLLRTHKDSEIDYSLKARQLYPVQHIRMSKAVAESEVVECLFRTNERRSLKKIVTELLPFGSACAEHVVLSAGLTPSDLFPSDEKAEEQQKEAFRSSQMLQDLMREIRNLESWFNKCWSNPPQGLILTKERSSKQDRQNQDDESAIYTEFEPFLLRQHRDHPHIQFETFDAALDEFFSKREGQKMAVAEASAKSAAEARLLKTKMDLERRAEGLRAEAASEEIQAQLIEHNLTTVDDVLLAVNSVLASGMNWDEVKALIQNEAEQGNPVAGLIHSLELEQNSMTLLLAEGNADSEDEESSDRTATVKVTVDLSLSAAANARMHFQRRKKHALKEQKTQEANETAMKAAEKKIQARAKKTQVVSSMHQLRKTHWFEKFYWFITTENYLVISGKDAQQNELLVKRYMKKDDVYVHADLHGASTTIIKNYRPGMAIPPISLHQAGVACVCRSKAWEGKVITSAWWVYPDQVSKTAPTGEYLTTGSFMIRGKKNYLPPASLTYGFGYLFKLEDACIDRHKGERAPKIEEEIQPRKTDPIVDEAEKSMTSEENEIKRSALDAFLDESVDHLVSENKHLPGLNPSVSEDGEGSFQRQAPRKNREIQKQSSEKERTADSRSESAQRKDSDLNEGNKGGSRRKKKGKRGEKDEEDVRMMAELLQSAGPKKTKQQRREERKQKKAEKRASSIKANQTTDTEVRETISKATEAPFASEQDRQVEDLPDDPGPTDQDSDEDNEEQMTSDAAEIRQLDSLTHQPLPDDTILFAVPVCGPYESLVHFKYKVKLLPGTIKKGKAGKQAVELLTHRDTTSRDLQLIKTVPDPEVINVMLGSVKLSMPGMSKIQQAQKSQKKKNKTQI